MSPSIPPSPSGPSRETIGAYLDGELSPAEAAEVLAWLEAHPDALREVEEHRRVWSMLSAYEDEPVPAGFAERVLERAGTRPRLRLVRGGGVRAVAIAAGVVVALGVGAIAARRFLRERAPQASDAHAVASAVDAVPAALLESDDLVDLASYSDEEFETLLATDPSVDVVDVPRGPRGG
jgi:anti-sigma factor RsiW